VWAEESEAQWATKLEVVLAQRWVRMMVSVKGLVLVLNSALVLAMKLEVKRAEESGWMKEEM
jgi:hypothetical protein